MQSALAIGESDQEQTVAKSTAQSGGSGQLLLAVLELLERSGIRYCVLHGYENYPLEVKSDVDCVIDSEFSQVQIFQLLHRNRMNLGAEIVRYRAYHFVLSGRNADGSPYFLTLDFCVDCQIDSVSFYSGEEFLRNRRRHGQFWVPSAHMEFGSYLARSVAKSRLDDERLNRLSVLFQRDAARCETQVARFWGTESRALIVPAARTGNWQLVRQSSDSLRRELRQQAMLRFPGRCVVNLVSSQINRLSRIPRPDGISVTILGPDGAGKSSLIEALSHRMDCVFSRSVCLGFAPPLHRLFYRTRHPTDQPHALPLRSLIASLTRAVYWFLYYTVGYLSVHVALARSVLVLYDRHFLDILIDVKRYRYGGPVWIPRLIWHLMPKPDLVILLNAPPEVIQSRKQEVSFEETERQCKAYLSLVSTLTNGHVVDAAQGQNGVATDVSKIILQHLSMRLSRSYGLTNDPIVKIAGSVLPRGDGPDFPPRGKSAD